MSDRAVAATPAASRRVVVVALGSVGDVHPFVGLGRELARRGHEVVVLANETFREVVERAGLGFAPAGDVELFETLLRDPDVWHRRRAPRIVFGQAVRFLPEMVAGVREVVAPGRTLIVASSLALGARLVQEADGVPLATVHLAPAVLRSVVRPPRIAVVPFGPRWPRRWNRFVWWLGDRVLGRWIEGPLNEERARLGLPPVRRPLAGWWSSPELVIGLFPPWFAPPPPDWPPQLRLTGFPLWDEGEQRPPDPELDRWLVDGTPPVVFTAGSAHLHAERFFAISVDAAERIGARAVLVTRERANVPGDLPAGVVHRSYVPFGRLLPRASALVHHGGIGTTAQAFAAGIPQLVVPWAHDQHDNADRVERLGAGSVLPAIRYGERRAAGLLQDLLGSPLRRARAAALAPRLDGAAAVRESCELIEALARRRLG